MEYYSNQIGQLVEQLSSLPGIGAKTAQRLAFHIIDMPQERVEKLAETMVSARNNPLLQRMPDPDGSGTLSDLRKSQPES